MYGYEIKTPIKCFDPHTIKFFDKVIVRNEDTDKWSISFSSHTGSFHKGFNCMNDTTWKQCLPYNDDTKELIGSTVKAASFYRWWERRDYEGER